MQYGRNTLPFTGPAFTVSIGGIVLDQVGLLVAAAVVVLIGVVLIGLTFRRRKSVEEV